MKSMDEIIIPETTITPEQYSVNARQLVAAIMLQATRDYCKEESKPKRNAILKDLRSSHMDFVSNGMSAIIAEQLEKNADEIKIRIMKDKED